MSKVLTSFVPQMKSALKMTPLIYPKKEGGVMFGSLPTAVAMQQC